MCLSCGCNIPNDNHGNDAHITYSDVVAAAGAAHIKPGRAVKNIVSTFQRAKRDQKSATKAGAKAQAGYELKEGPDHNPEAGG